MKRSEQWSIVLAITVNGYLNFTMFQGAITFQIFEDFLGFDILPCTTPGWSVIVIDNVSIHRSRQVAQLCRDFGVELEYLPPYSPDYNPTEKSFKLRKALYGLRKSPKL